MSRVLDSASKESFNEHILPMKDCKVEVQSAEATNWKSKVDGTEYPAVKLAVRVVDLNAHCEHEGARPSIINDQFCLMPYPYMGKDGKEGSLRPGKLYDLESALGFEPLFVDEAGNKVEPHITKTGNKVRPNKPGISRKVNPDFYTAYFDDNDVPRFGAFEGKVLSADIEVDAGSEQYGPKNVVTRYKKAQ